MYYAIKILLTAGIVVAVSEASKRSSILGGLLASLPLISFLGMIWLYIDTGSTEKVAELSSSIFWLVLPSLPPISNSTQPNANKPWQSRIVTLTLRCPTCIRRPHRMTPRPTSRVGRGVAG